MREIQASDAKAHLPSVLDEVDRGETLIVTRHGKPIARLILEADRRQIEIDQAIEDIKAMRRRTGKITVEALISARREGHKY